MGNGPRNVGMASLAQSFAAWGLDPVALRADLIAAELVANACRDSGSVTRLEVRRQGAYIVVSATVNKEYGPDAGAPGPVELYRTASRVRPTPTGQIVWAAIRVAG